MNTKQMQYAIELSKTLNISQTAAALGISQPALSKQILNLEDDLGVKLFDRTTLPLKLTSAGEHFIKAAESLIYEEEKLLHSMKEFKSGDRGSLVIGVSPFRSLYLLPDVIKKVKEKYPKIKIVLQELGLDQLRNDAIEGKYDFAIVNLPVDESVLEVTPLEADKLVLAVPKNMLGELQGVKSGDQIDFKLCKNLSFVLQGQSHEMRKLFDKLCAHSEISPTVSVEVIGMSTAWSMARSGIGATLLPLQFVNNFMIDDSIALFPIKNNLQTRQPVIITRKGNYLSEYAKYAIELLTDKK